MSGPFIAKLFMLYVIRSGGANQRARMQGSATCGLLGCRLPHQFGGARGFTGKVLGINEKAHAHKAKRQAEFAPSAAQPSAARASRPAAVTRTFTTSIILPPARIFSSVIDR